MNGKYFNIVQSYVSKKTGIKENSLTPDTTIADLKIDGDDVKDFLFDFFKTYNIDCDFSQLEKYMPLEGGFVTSTIKSLYNYMQGKKTPKTFVDWVSLKDLEDALVNKKWILEKYYPKKRSKPKLNVVYNYGGKIKPQLFQVSAARRGMQDKL